MSKSRQADRHLVIRECVCGGIQMLSVATAHQEYSCVVQGVPRPVQDTDYQILFLDNHNFIQEKSPTKPIKPKPRTPYEPKILKASGYNKCLLP